MSKRILIANRGEIAIRIMRSVKKLGYTSIAIRSTKEPEAMYLQYADEIVDSGGTSEDKTVFLDPQRLIAIAMKNKIDMIHPGYGFLSENPEFASACEAEGIVFIGPSPALIRSMGLKPVARDMAQQAGMPLVPGSNGVLKGLDEALETAKQIGYPVLLKAAAGGGGRGMRVVEKAETMERMLKSASEEALSAFGNGDMFLEKYIGNPKHIEVQILGDQHGHVLHFGERECSLQRKHQKLIEEAPSAGISDEMRVKMCEMAVHFAKTTGYYSAGTIEYIVDADGSFYFMEMNTRIQVEHPVTEMVYDTDLIEWQIRIANGERLTLQQHELKAHGWSIECRINSEDAQNRFSPETGFIEMVRFPEGEGIRIESGIKSGSVVTQHFDSMLAKLIVHAETRTDAIEKMKKALQAIRINGIKTSVPFSLAVMNSEAFQNGSYSTRWVEESYDPEMFYQEEDEMMGALAATIAYAIEYQKIASSDPETSNDALSMWVINKRIHK